MPPLVNDLGFPQLRKDGSKNNSRRVGLAVDGMTEQGAILPGILNMGRILDAARFNGLPRTDGEKSGILDPTNAADIIVTVLYQHSRSVLAQFLDCDDTTEFKYEHLHLAESQPGALEDVRPFVIVRNGDKVEAGFREGYDAQGAAATDWDDVVRYTVLPSGAWRQDLFKFTPTILSGLPRPTILSLCNGDGREKRVPFEVDAVQVLKPAITFRRWFKQPGFNITVTLTTHEEEGDSAQADEGSGEKTANNSAQM